MPVPSDIGVFLDREQALRGEIKKNCVLCMGRSRLHTNKSDRNPEKEQVQTALRELYMDYNAKFDFLRRKNYAEGQIANAGDNKRIVLDIIEMCRGCDRSTDLVNRELNQLK